MQGRRIGGTFLAVVGGGVPAVIEIGHLQLNPNLAYWLVLGLVALVPAALIMIFWPSPLFPPKGKETSGRLLLFAVIGIGGGALLSALTGAYISVPTDTKTVAADRAVQAISNNGSAPPSLGSHFVLIEPGANIDGLHINGGKIRTTGSTIVNKGSLKDVHVNHADIEAGTPPNPGAPK